MKHRKLLVFDTETGGLDASDSSILSFGAVVWHDGGILDELYLEIAEPEILADPKALAVNGIDVENLKVNGVSPLAAVNAIEAFLQKNDMNKMVYLAGHNAAGFDVPFLKRLWRLGGRSDYGKRFSYHVLDTMILAFALGQVERLPGVVKYSLDNLCSTFGVSLRSEGAAHNSLEDARATAKLLTKLLGKIS